MKNKFIVTWYYPKYDKEFHSDHISVEVKYKNKIIYSLTDDYHDGSGKGIYYFLDGIKYALGDIEVIEQNKHRSR